MVRLAIPSGPRAGIETSIQNSHYILFFIDFSTYFTYDKRTN